MDVKVFVLFAVLLILCGHAESRRYWFSRWLRHNRGKDSSTEARSAFKDNGDNRFGFMLKGGRLQDENKPSARDYGDNRFGFMLKGGRIQDENKPSARDYGDNRFGFMLKGGRIQDENKPSARRYGDNRFGFMLKGGRISDENKPSALHSMDEKLTEDISDEDVENALDVLQKAVQYRHYYG